MDTNNNFVNFIRKNKIHKSWHMFFIQNYDIIKSIKTHLCDYKNILPAKENVFRVFTTDLKKIKVILLGQDPYHTPDVAMGLSFSVSKYF